MNRISVAFNNKQIDVNRRGKRLMVISDDYQPGVPMFIVKEETGRLNRKYIVDTSLAAEDLTFSRLKEYVDVVLSKLKKKSRTPPELISLFLKQNLMVTADGVKLMSDDKCLASITTHTNELDLMVSDYHGSTEKLKRQLHADLFPYYIENFGASACSFNDESCFIEKINRLLKAVRQLETMTCLEDTSEPLEINELIASKLDPHHFIQELIEEIQIAAPLAFFDNNGMAVKVNVKTAIHLGYPVALNDWFGGTIQTSKGIIAW